MAFTRHPFSTYWVNYDLGLSPHCPFLQALLFRILLTSVHIGTCSQFQQLPFSNETLFTASGWELYFLRNSLPVQSSISFSSATFSIKQTLRAAPAGWKCPPLTCTALAQCSGQVWYYALANKWHPTHYILSFQQKQNQSTKKHTVKCRHNMVQYNMILYILLHWLR